MSNSEVDIVNKGLTRLGVPHIASFRDNSKAARLATSHYDSLRQQELRKYPWRFAIKRAELTRTTEEDPFDDMSIFNWPGDCLRILPLGHQYYLDVDDWDIEGRKIYIREEGPLRLRYIHDVQDVGLMDVLFRDALAMRLAQEWCEDLTNSNTKLQLAQASYKDSVETAYKIDGIEAPAREFREGSWVAVRYRGVGLNSRSFYLGRY